VASGAFGAGKIAGENLFSIQNRREAIHYAIKIAKDGDLILITGKGSEQKMAVANGKYIDWDDREVAREELKQVASSK
jgi:UDP-N-acetylmuramoyl-L-alanyl-D-glutamate--2,6-diaminopimelate ligase